LRSLQNIYSIPKYFVFFEFTYKIKPTTALLNTKYLLWHKIFIVAQAFV